MKVCALLIAMFAASASSAWAQHRVTGVYGVHDLEVVSEFAGLELSHEYTALPDVVESIKGSVPRLPGSGARSASDELQSRSAVVHGVSAATYARDDGSHDTGAVAMTGNRTWGLMLGFEAGPWAMRAAHQNRAVAAVAPATAMGNNVDAKNSVLAANLRVGAGTAYAAYSVSRGYGSAPLWNPDNPYSASLASTPSTDSRDMLVGVALPCGGVTWLASFIRKNDRDLANRDANQLALGATYAMARHTDLYVAYSRINNRSGSAYSVGNASSNGGATSAVNIGMRHGF
ncbi:porin [Massilia sp. PWRC2]|uniref:porin n=1 Tax=Massilia sp. PWRC2 TaxID=2804626 RepID=UPI003CFA4A23